MLTPLALLPLQLPAQAPGKAAAQGPSARVPPLWGGYRGSPGFGPALGPAAIWRVNQLMENLYFSLSFSPQLPVTLPDKQVFF